MQGKMVQNAVCFGAKCSAFWCKIACVLVLNAAHFGAKRDAKGCKMRDEKHKHSQQLYKQNLIEP